MGCKFFGTTMEPQVILESGLAAAMLELGQRWNRGEAFLVEVVARAGRG